MRSRGLYFCPIILASNKSSFTSMHILVAFSYFTSYRSFLHSSNLVQLFTFSSFLLSIFLNFHIFFFLESNSFEKSLSVGGRRWSGETSSCGVVSIFILVFHTCVSSTHRRKYFPWRLSCLALCDLPRDFQSQNCARILCPQINHYQCWFCNFYFFEIQ